MKVSDAVVEVAADALYLAGASNKEADRNARIAISAAYPHIRAAVLAEVRAVVPDPAYMSTHGTKAACEAWDACREQILDALTTLEQQP